MGFDDGRIVLDSANGSYYAGQTLRGRLEFEQERVVKTFRGIYVDIKGYCKIYWETTHERRVDDRTETYTEAHESYEEYLHTRIYLAGDKDGEHHLNPGHHVFPFETFIPKTCPSSFEASNGHIRYEVKVVVDRAFKIDQQMSSVFRVIAPLDLNANPRWKEPIEIDITESYCCWCVSSGSSQTLVKVPMSGFCPGQVVPVELSCINDSTVVIDRITVHIKKQVIYRATTNSDSRSDDDTVVSVSKGPVSGNATRNWRLDLAIPPMDAYNFETCKFIDVNYNLYVSQEVSGCHEDNEDFHPVMIGSIPIVGFQDNYVNPLADQMPKMTLEPNQFLPTVSTYPVMNQPQPAVSPYPNHSPYPGYNNQPYPGGNPPYPGANPQQPGISPYPGPNPPYPTSPYPGANPPYPGGNMPYSTPTTNPPYSNPTMPYPVTSPINAPYPSVPYTGSGPNTNAPQTGAALLKTGNFGFTAPPLPAGTNVPYPASPFATANAPAPATPDVPAGSNFGVDNSNPPFNPEYKGN